MAMVSKHRRVNLLDNRIADRRFIQASVYRDYPANQLEEIESSWAKARESAAARGQAVGLAPFEHGHWDWRNKADSVEGGHHMLVAVELDGGIQGLMAVLRHPRPARLGDGHLVYVDYLESAPWNLKGAADPPRFLDVGSILMAEAVRISVEGGFEGRVGLHSLPQAEAFYNKCRMTRLGNDPDYYDLPYYEHPGRSGIDWLVSIGESP
ncbi:MAG: hypothetical protein L0Y71_08450 [Gemmataceae bacterium]|nr:hypothetical protein [Gemmataceae bacterium]